MDLGFVIPASLVVAIGLLSRAPWAVTVAYAFLGFQTLIVAAVAGMAIMMTARSDPAANPVLLVITLVLTLALGGVFGILLRKLAISVGPLPRRVIRDPLASVLEISASPDIYRGSPWPPAE